MLCVALLVWSVLRVVPWCVEREKLSQELCTVKRKEFLWWCSDLVPEGMCAAFACVHGVCVCVCVCACVYVRTHMLCDVYSGLGCVIGPSQGLVERSLHFMSFSPSLCIPSFPFPPPPPRSIHTCPVTNDSGIQCSDSTRGSIRRDRISHRQGQSL